MEQNPMSLVVLQDLLVEVLAEAPEAAVQVSPVELVQIQIVIQVLLLRYILMVELMVLRPLFITLVLVEEEQEAIQGIWILEMEVLKLVEKVLMELTMFLVKLVPQNGKHY